MSEKADPTPSFEGFEKIPIRIAVRIGPGRCRLSTLANLKPGDVIPLDPRVGEPFDLISQGIRLGKVEPVVEGAAVAMKLVEVPEEDDASGG